MIKKLFLNDKFILILIIINSTTIFVEGFNNIPINIIHTISAIDVFITLLFTYEVYIKTKTFGWKTYMESPWNKLDISLVAIALPTIIFPILHVHEVDLSWLLIFRTLRVFKFFRFIKFIPNIEQILRGIKLAIKDSLLVLLGFIVYNFVISIFSCYLFKESAPQYFGDPLISFYSTFRIFTIEGWYEIPDTITANSGIVVAFFSKIYFMVILITGGIFGLSLVNSIFVDAMLKDNNDDLLEKMSSLNEKIDALHQKMDINNEQKNR